MSRLDSLSPEAIKAMFSPDSDEYLICLVTLSNYDDTGNTIRLADGYTQRLTEYTTDEQVVYGTVSNGNSYIFVPINITLPSEEDNAFSRCSISINDVTKVVMPMIQSDIKRPPTVLMQLVLSSSPNTIEASFSGFYVNSITYSADTVQLEINMINYQTEPFPCFSFTPKYFPGLF